MKCKFCNNEFQKLANSHIIPRSFYRKVRGDGNYSLLLNVDDNEETQEFKQAGISDTTILCESCERRFSPYDKHGYETLTEALETKKKYIDHLGNACAFYVEKADYNVFKLFVLSVLWRASVSSHYFFKHIKLGSHEEKLRKRIHEGDAGAEDDYSILCFHLLGQHYPKTILPPFGHRIEGVNFCRLYLPDVGFLIKVDSRPSPSVLKPLVMKPQSSIYLIFQDYFGSPEMRFMESTKVLVQKHAGIPAEPTYRYEKSRW